MCTTRSNFQSPLTKPFILMDLIIMQQIFHFTINFHRPQICEICPEILSDVGFFVVKPKNKIDILLLWCTKVFWRAFGYWLQNKKKLEIRLYNSTKFEIQICNYSMKTNLHIIPACVVSVLQFIWENFTGYCRYWIKHTSSSKSFVIWASNKELYKYADPEKKLSLMA